jgi:hypothetical protein
MINRRLLLLVAAAGGLAAYGVWSDEGGLFKRLTGAGVDLVASTPATIPEVSKTVATVTPAKSLNPLGGLAVDALSAISERPLFNPSRAPAPQEQQVATEPAEVPVDQPEQKTFNPDEFTLLAVSSSATGKIALVRRNTTNEIFHIKEGESLSDWQVVAVGDRQISVGIDGQTVELKMFGKRLDVPGQPPAQNESDAQPSNDETGNQSANPLARSANRTKQLPPDGSAENQPQADPQTPAEETDPSVDATDPSIDAADQSADQADDGSDQ